jgi:hypothetical protein
MLDVNFVILDADFKQKQTDSSELIYDMIYIFNWNWVETRR